MGSGYLMSMTITSTTPLIDAMNSWQIRHAFILCLCQQISWADDRVVEANDIHL